MRRIPRAADVLKNMLTLATKNRAETALTWKTNTRITVQISLKSTFLKREERWKS